MQQSNNHSYDPDIVISLADRRAGQEPSCKARPVPEDFGLTGDDLRIVYSPGRVGSLLAIIMTVVTAAYTALDWWMWTNPWMSALGLMYGAMLGAFAGLGILAVIHWCDPLLGSFWPTYGRLRKYREALNAALLAEENEQTGRPLTSCNRA